MANFMEVFVSLSEYFENAKGLGVLATADASGRVNAAVYARPHFTDAGDQSTVAFIMADRLSHTNIQSNPHAAYLFMEEGQGHKGKRLHLTKLREESSEELVAAICRRCNYSMYGSESLRYVVFFRVDEVLPLIGPSPG
jgi:hypothetical protein